MLLKLYLRKRKPGTHSTGGRIDPRNQTDSAEKRTILLPGITSRLSVHTASSCSLTTKSTTRYPLFTFSNQAISFSISKIVLGQLTSPYAGVVGRGPSTSPLASSSFLHELARGTATTLTKINIPRRWRRIGRSRISLHPHQPLLLQMTQKQN